MAQRNNHRIHRSAGVAAALTGASSSLRTVQTSVPRDGGSVWTRRRVLLLNSTYEPLTALPLRRAIVMLICGKAEAIHDAPAGSIIHSASSSIVVPSVIRLRVYVRVPYRTRTPMTRAALMHRDRFCCAYCGAKADTVDHVVPRSRGGEHCWENCVACCSSCNHRKGDRLLIELGWTLFRVPRPPTGPHWQLIAKVKEVDPSWERYLGEGAA